MFIKLALVCLAPVIINSTDTWTERDAEVVKEAGKRCEINYPTAPCVKIFVKKGELDYHVICGAPQPSEGDEVTIQ